MQVSLAPTLLIVCLGAWWSCTLVSSRALLKRASFYIANETVCVVDSVLYHDGESIPSDDPCESCKCRPPGFACVLRNCEVKPGCKAVRKEGECCPEYICGCEHNGIVYNDGDVIRNTESPCYTCYCQGSSIACALVDCYFRHDCEPTYVPGECCPRYDKCSPEQTSRPFNRFSTVPSTTKYDYKQNEVQDNNPRQRPIVYGQPGSSIAGVIGDTTILSNEGREGEIDLEPSKPDQNVTFDGSRVTEPQQNDEATSTTGQVSTVGESLTEKSETSEKDFVETTKPVTSSDHTLIVHSTTESVDKTKIPSVPFESRQTTTENYEQTTLGASANRGGIDDTVPIKEHRTEENDTLDSTSENDVYPTTLTADGVKLEPTTDKGLLSSQDVATTKVGSEEVTVSGSFITVRVTAASTERSVVLITKGDSVGITPQSISVEDHIVVKENPKDQTTQVDLTSISQENTKTQVPTTTLIAVTGETSTEKSATDVITVTRNATLEETELSDQLSNQNSLTEDRNDIPSKTVGSSASETQGNSVILSRATTESGVFLKTTVKDDFLLAVNSNSNEDNHKLSTLGSSTSTEPIIENENKSLYSTDSDQKSDSTIQSVTQKLESVSTKVIDTSIDSVTSAKSIVTEENDNPTSREAQDSILEGITNQDNFHQTDTPAPSQPISADIDKIFSEETQYVTNSPQNDLSLSSQSTTPHDHEITTTTSKNNLASETVVSPILDSLHKDDVKTTSFSPVSQSATSSPVNNDAVVKEDATVDNSGLDKDGDLSVREEPEPQQSFKDEVTERTLQQETITTVTELPLSSSTATETPKKDTTQSGDQPHDEKTAEGKIPSDKVHEAEIGTPGSLTDLKNHKDVTQTPQKKIEIVDDVTTVQSSNVNLLTAEPNIQEESKRNLTSSEETESISQADTINKQAVAKSAEVDIDLSKGYDSHDVVVVKEIKEIVIPHFQDSLIDETGTNSTEKVVLQSLPLDEAFFEPLPGALPTKQERQLTTILPSSSSSFDSLLIEQKQDDKNEKNIENTVSKPVDAPKSEIIIPITPVNKSDSERSKVVFYSDEQGDQPVEILINQKETDKLDVEKVPGTETSKTKTVDISTAFTESDNAVHSSTSKSSKQDVAATIPGEKLENDNFEQEKILPVIVDKEQTVKESSEILNEAFTTPIPVSKNHVASTTLEPEKIVNSESSQDIALLNQDKEITSSTVVPNQIGNNDAVLEYSSDSILNSSLFVEGGGRNVSEDLGADKTANDKYDDGNQNITFVDTLFPSSNYSQNQPIPQKIDSDLEHVNNESLFFAADQSVVNVLEDGTISELVKNSTEIRGVNSDDNPTVYIQNNGSIVKDETITEIPLKSVNTSERDATLSQSYEDQMVIDDLLSEPVENLSFNDDKNKDCNETTTPFNKAKPNLVPIPILYSDSSILNNNSTAILENSETIEPEVQNVLNESKVLIRQTNETTSLVSPEVGHELILEKRLESELDETNSSTNKDSELTRENTKNNVPEILSKTDVSSSSKEKVDTTSGTITTLPETESKTTIEKNINKVKVDAESASSHYATDMNHETPKFYSTYLHGIDFRMTDDDRGALNKNVPAFSEQNGQEPSKPHQIDDNLSTRKADPEVSKISSDVNAQSTTGSPSLGIDENFNLSKGTNADERILTTSETTKSREVANVSKPNLDDEVKIQPTNNYQKEIVPEHSPGSTDEPKTDNLEVKTTQSGKQSATLNTQDVQSPSSEAPNENISSVEQGTTASTHFTTMLSTENKSNFESTKSEPTSKIQNVKLASVPDETKQDKTPSDHLTTGTVPISDLSIQDGDSVNSSSKLTTKLTELVTATAV